MRDFQVFAPKLRGAVDSGAVGAARLLDTGPIQGTAGEELLLRSDL